ncbi:MAG: TIR domain-containing protein, partial [Methanobacterium sp.]
MLFEEESRIYNIFISHIGKQEEEYSIFIQKLSSASDFRYNNLGILDKINQNELQEQIKTAEI